MDSQVDDTALLLASMSLLIFFNPYVMDLGVHTLQSSYIEALTQNLMVQEVRLQDGNYILYVEPSHMGLRILKKTKMIPLGHEFTWPWIHTVRRWPSANQKKTHSRTWSASTVTLVFPAHKTEKTTVCLLKPSSL